MININLNSNIFVNFQRLSCLNDLQKFLHNASRTKCLMQMISCKCLLRFLNKIASSLFVTCFCSFTIVIQIRVVFMLKGKMGLKACGLTSSSLSSINLIKLVWISCKHLTPKKAVVTACKSRKSMPKGFKAPYPNLSFHLLKCEDNFTRL